MDNIVILVGPPGAGKTSFAEMFYPDHAVCSTDVLRTTEGTYTYDRSQNKTLAVRCFRKFLDNVRAKTPVVVDNTNVTLRALAPYIEVALLHDVKPRVDVFGVYTLDDYVTRNVHDVPESVVRKMHESMMTTLQEWPERWPTYTVRY